jgi:hypothetical protein
MTAALLMAAGCADPLQSAAVAALGPEDPRVPPGPLHRPGQPCLVCHGEGGSATRMSVAGTVFRDPTTRLPVADAKVELLDAVHKSIVVRSNCAGNFWLYPATFTPALPMWAAVEQGTHRVEMESPLHLDGDCGSCHSDPAAQTSAGHLFVTDSVLQAATIPLSVCP